MVTGFLYAATNPPRKLFPGNTFECLHVAFPGGFDHGSGKRRRGGIGIYLPITFRTSKPVTDVLFIEAGLHLARFVAFERPVPGGIRREHLVGKHECAVTIDPKFEFSVGQDDPFGLGEFCRLLINIDAGITQFAGTTLT